MGVKLVYIGTQSAKDSLLVIYVGVLVARSVQVLSVEMRTLVPALLLYLLLVVGVWGP